MNERKENAWISLKNTPNGGIMALPPPDHLSFDLERVVQVPYCLHKPYEKCYASENRISGITFLTLACATKTKRKVFLENTSIHLAKNYFFMKSVGAAKKQDLTKMSSKNTPNLRLCPYGMGNRFFTL